MVAGSFEGQPCLEITSKLQSSCLHAKFFPSANTITYIATIQQLGSWRAASCYLFKTPGILQKNDSPKEVSQVSTNDVPLMQNYGFPTFKARMLLFFVY